VQKLQPIAVLNILAANLHLFLPPKYSSVGGRDIFRHVAKTEGERGFYGKGSGIRGIYSQHSVTSRNWNTSATHFIWRENCALMFCAPHRALETRQI
jgi:hypothetical protein